jgi:hypothetical protein
VEEQAFSRWQSKHYEFLYRTVQRDAAKPLLSAADHIYLEVKLSSVRPLYLGAW